MQQRHANQTLSPSCFFLVGGPVIWISDISRPWNKWFSGWWVSRIKSTKCIVQSYHTESFFFLAKMGNILIYDIITYSMNDSNPILLMSRLVKYRRKYIINSNSLGIGIQAFMTQGKYTVSPKVWWKSRCICFNKNRCGQQLSLHHFLIQFLFDSWNIFFAIKFISRKYCRLMMGAVGRCCCKMCWRCGSILSTVELVALCLSKAMTLKLNPKDARNRMLPCWTIEVCNGRRRRYHS